MKGPAHESLQTALIAALAVPLQSLAGLEAAAGFVAGGLFGTFWLSPDLDLAGKGSSRAAENWGPLKVIWYPYGAIFRHRRVSHSWLLGPTSRLLYLAVLVAPALPHLAPWIRTHPAAFEAALLGYFVSQWAHAALDGVWFGVRRPVRRKRRRA